MLITDGDFSEMCLENVGWPSLGEANVTLALAEDVALPLASVNEPRSVTSSSPRQTRYLFVDALEAGADEDMAVAEGIGNGRADSGCGHR